MASGVGDGTGEGGGYSTGDGLTTRTDKASSPGKPYDQFGGSEGVKKDPGGNRTSPIRK